MPHRRACDLTTAERAEIIHRSEIGAGLDEQVVERLAAASTALDFRRRRFVYRAGEPSNAVFIVARGRVKLCCIETATNREAVIDILPTGSLFGEYSLYAATGEHQMSAAAFEQTCVLRIPAGEFQWAMGESRELNNHTLRVLGQRLSRSERRVADFALDAIPARIEKLLADLSARYGREAEDGVLIDIAIPHREIASIVGSTRESVTVRLNDLRRAGIIDFVDRKILLKHQPAVATVATV
jgi:CRP-like cAMP-binding protein